MLRGWSSCISPAWIEQALLQTGTQSIRRRQLHLLGPSPDVSDPTTIVGLLPCGGTLTGFTYLELPSRVSPGRDHEDADVRHVSDTAIRRELQGTRLVGTLMSMVEVELAARGVRFLTRNAKIPSGYADKVARHYRDRIIERHDHESPWGPQRWFRIKL